MGAFVLTRLPPQGALSGRRLGTQPTQPGLPHQPWKKDPSFYEERGGVGPWSVGLWQGELILYLYPVINTF